VTVSGISAGWENRKAGSGVSASASLARRTDPTRPSQLANAPYKQTWQALPIKKAE